MMPLGGTGALYSAAGPYDQTSFFYMGMTEGGRRLSMFPQDYEEDD